MIGLLAQSATDSQGGTLLPLLFIVGLALIFGAWSANAAERKGIRRSTGWLLGIFLGLLGRIVVGVMRDRTIRQAPPMTPRSEPPAMPDPQR